jgi:hypothetical protein
MGPMSWNRDEADATGGVALMEADPVPGEVSVILSALEAAKHSGKHPQVDRRAARRLPFRVTATMRLFVDAAGTPGRVIYTRDVNRRSLGFVTRHRLPLGYGGMLEIPSEEGGSQTVYCTLLRCNEASPGWYEGSVYFNRDQPQFDELR